MAAQTPRKPALRLRLIAFAPDQPNWFAVPNWKLTGFRGQPTVRGGDLVKYPG
jgi:hypothetical protein